MPGLLSLLRRMLGRPNAADIVMTSGDSDERVAALKEITDMRLLEEMSSALLTRAADAFDHSDDKSGFQDRDVAATILWKLKTQEELARIAKNRESKREAEAALTSTINSLTDQAYLAQVATHAYFSSVRSMAAFSVTDQKILAEIATRDEDCWVREVAVKKLTDQALLARIARQERHEEPRAAAVRRLTDRGLVAKIATDDLHESVRKAAQWTLKSQREVLEFVRASDSDYFTRKDAVRLYLTDQVFLAEIATTASDYSIRMEAVEKLTDQTLLAKIEKNDADADVRWVAKSTRKQLGGQE